MPQPDQTSAPPSRVAVVGGGISGLAAAHRLVEQWPQADLTLFERATRLGGVLDTVEQDGFLVERSADSFITKLPWAVDLCRRLDLGDELLPTDESRRRALVVRKGRMLPVPEGFFVMSPRQLWPMLTTPVLSFRGKLRLLLEPLVPPRQVQEVSDGAGELADESVESFVSRRFGRETFERLVQPLVAGIYTADPARLSIAATMPEFLEAERRYGSLLRAYCTSRVKPAAVRTSHFRGQSSVDQPEPSNTASGARYGLFVAPRNGMASLVTAIASRLSAATVRTGIDVTRVDRQGGKWLLTTREGRAPEQRSSFDAVIIALPAHAAAEVLHACDRRLAAKLAAIPYAGCAVVSAGFRSDQLGRTIDSFGFVVPHIERRRIIAASFPSAKFPGRAPDGCVLIRAFLGGALQPELVELSDDALQQLVLGELRDLLGVKGTPSWINVARWPRSMPQYHVGHPARVGRIEQRLARWPGLALAGNAYHGVGVPQCIHSGETAAEAVCQWLRQEHVAAE